MKISRIIVDKTILNYMKGSIYGILVDGSILQFWNPDLKLPRKGKEISFKRIFNQLEESILIQGDECTIFFSEEIFKGLSRQCAKITTKNQDEYEVPVEIIDFQDIYSRIRFLINTDILKDKTVAIFGLGSGGGALAVELAKCGVGKFLLVDPDILETANISRHICGISDIGRFKTFAVKDKLIEVNPKIEVTSYNKEIKPITGDLDRERIQGFTGEIEEINLEFIPSKSKPDAQYQNLSSDDIDEIFRSSDLILACTGNPAANLLLNDLSVKFKTQVIYASAFERAEAGYVLKVIPGITSCLNCVITGYFPEIMEFDKSIVTPIETIDYAEVSDAAELRSEPGLGIDVGFITLIQSKMALLSLINENETRLGQFDHNLIIWGNRKKWIFNQILGLYYSNPKLLDDCEVCGDLIKGKKYSPEDITEKSFLEEQLTIDDSLMKSRFPEFHLKKIEKDGEVLYFWYGLIGSSKILIKYPLELDGEIVVLVEPKIVHEEFATHRKFIKNRPNVPLIIIELLNILKDQ